MLADEGELSLGGRFGEEVIDAGLLGDLARGETVIARHHDGPDAHRAELVEADFHALLDGVLEVDDAEYLAVA